jgi:hypothetical protein
MEGTVVDLNMKIWTVDVVSKFDQKFYPNVQISSPYQNPNNGEGIYVMPDIGSKCHVCIPSDGPAPFILDFIMPQETQTNVGTDDEASGQAASEDDSDASFAGGRPRPKPGDIFIKGRDGNFVILHKGGVLQIGSTELAQRIYIPLENLITDVSQNYRHHNTGGSINWFLAAGESENNPHTVYKHTYRLRAGVAKASIRVAMGELRDPVKETDGDLKSSMGLYDIGTKDNPILCEVTLAPDGFEPDKGASIPGTTEELVKLRYLFDKAGNALLRAEGSVVLQSAKTLTLRGREAIHMQTDGTFLLSGGEGGNIVAENFLQVTTNGMRLNAGSNPAAHVGSSVEILISPADVFKLVTPIPTPGGPFPLLSFAPMTLKGFIKTGQIKLLI